MKAFLVAGVATLALALAAANVTAQEQPAPKPVPTPGPGIEAAPGLAAPGAEDNPFTVANIDPATPFGTVDITAAGTNADTIKAWSDTLAEDLRLEITQRCDVIIKNKTTFPTDATSFCSTWTVVEAAEEAAPAPVKPLATPAAPTPM